MILDAMQDRHRWLQKWVAAHHRAIRDGLSRSRKRGEDGRVIGIRLTDDIRERLCSVQKKYELRSYRKTVITAVVIGLHVLEAHQPPPPREEE